MVMSFCFHSKFFLEFCFLQWYLSCSRLTWLSFLFELDFLSSDIMLGEGNILAHLMIVGYKVPYQQVGGSLSLMLFATAKNEHFFFFSSFFE